MNRTLAALIAATALLPIAAGCGSSTVVQGQVTYDGKDVENGSINFLPADGDGPTCGASITAGRYEVEIVTPGRKKVQVVGVKAVPFARSSEEMERMSKEAAARGDASGIIDRADTVPADAQGNNVEIDVKPGSQTLDFHLKPPGAVESGE